MRFNSPYEFPNPQLADPDGEGFICIGGDLEADTLLHAYSQGLFPWFNEDDPICWWCPEPRCIIYPEQFVPSKSLLRNMKKHNYHIKIDSAFADVIQQCSAPRNYSQETWISSDIIQSYTHLHHLGFAHSVEVWDNDELIGGLYGLNLGRGFFGESMFHKRTDASKMAFYALMLLAQQEHIPFVDCQLPNSHLMSLGAKTLSRDKFLQQLQQVLHEKDINWQPYRQCTFSTADIAEHGCLNINHTVNKKDDQP